jgi:predicted regulator of Ras-like GTPase activity (Roadblock/LC7/MglB family)
VTQNEALADLMEISSQVEAAVVLGPDGEPLASTLGDEGRAGELARAGRELLAAAERVRPSGDAGIAQLDAATRGGSVFVVRDEDLTIVATTTPSPTVGLVFYDLKTCLKACRADGGATAEPGGDTGAAAAEEESAEPEPAREAEPEAEAAEVGVEVVEGEGDGNAAA